jgi:hypothetical protein
MLDFFIYAILFLAILSAARKKYQAKQNGQYDDDLDDYGRYDDWDEGEYYEDQPEGIFDDFEDFDYYEYDDM